MKTGYVQVSSQDQNLDMQRDAPQIDGCEKIPEEIVSGCIFEHPELPGKLTFAMLGALASAMAWGKKGGRKTVLSPQQVPMLKQLSQEKSISIDEISRQRKTSMATYYNYLSSIED